MALYNKNMTSRTNYYRTVTQIYSFDEHKHEKEPQVKLDLPPPPPSPAPAVPKKAEKFEVENKRVGKDPSVFGPPLWFSLHNASAYYPETASPAHAERMKNIIVGLPVLLPCETCKEHATAYIENNKHRLSEICKTKKDLFAFFVDFHNYVNQRLGKKILKYDEAHALYH
jgi:hypothetical protein